MEWVVQWFDKPTLRNPVLVEGLPGIGNVAKLAADFIIEQLKAEKCCSFFSNSLPNSVFINEKNLVELPCIDIYYKRLPTQKRDVIILSGDVQPADEQSCYLFSQKVLDVMKELGASELITLSGIALKQIPKQPKVFCTSTRKIYMKEYLKRGISNDLYGSVGPIIGVSGILTALAGKNNMPSVSLLAETYAHPMYLGVPGATALLKVIKEHLGIKMDISKMAVELAEIEKELKPTAKEIKAGKIDTGYIG